MFFFFHSSFFKCSLLFQLYCLVSDHRSNLEGAVTYQVLPPIIICLRPYMGNKPPCKVLNIVYEIWGGIAVIDWLYNHNSFLLECQKRRKLSKTSYRSNTSWLGAILWSELSLGVKYKLTWRYTMIGPFIGSKIQVDLVLNYGQNFHWESNTS